MTDHEKLEQAWNTFVDEIATQFRLYDFLTWLSKKLERN
jgi:hypothetical protein